MQNDENNTTRMVCKNCRHLIKIYKHPWNYEIDAAFGDIVELFGYGCLGTGKCVFFDSLLDGCEMFKNKTKENKED